jgi:two-component system phosphate regulon sensor histidine kinase PhoR
MFVRRYDPDYLAAMALANGPEPKHKMSLGTALSNVRWAERKAEAEAWAGAAWVAAKRRLAARWMPVAAAIGILAALVLLGALNALVALGAVFVLLLATATWPLDSGAIIDAIAGNAAAAPGNRLGDTERKSWRAVVDAIPTAALALDAAGTLVHHNRLAAEMFPKIKSGQPMSQVSRSPDLLVAVDRALTSEERIDVDLVERVPVERRVAATVSRLARSGAPSSPHVLITFRDLTEQDRLSQMRADFIANASHELRTPLASLRAFVETLQGPARDDVNARTRFLTLMASQAERMTRLIDDLLSLSRVEMRVHLPPRGIVELNETAAYVCQSIEPVAEAAKVKLSLVRDVAAARVRGDREEIVQVLQNLIQNAIKYGREDGTIEVRVGRDAARGAGGARVWVSVTDNGPGIAPEHLPRLTERFYRVNVVSSREKGGTGLGLAIVKHIMNRHRGELRIASRLGAGSTFTASFEELGASA